MIDNDNRSPSASEPETTGNFLVLYAGDAHAALANLFTDGGISTSSTAEVGASEAKQPSENNSALILHNLNIAVVKAPVETLETISTAEVEGGNPILTIEPERVVFAQEDSVTTPAVEGSPETWGLAITQVPNSLFSGRGIRICILDTGLDLNHPDFAGRQIVSNSFIDGEGVQDGHGHGTHCTGTACGPLQPSQSPRYGIAYEAEIYIGKVLNNEKGRGTDGSIIAGINWAVENQCAIISMSFGTRTIIGQPFSQVYETLARRAMAQGTLIIAAAGNDSFRSFDNPIFNPVEHPGNCPSIMAIGAVDSKLEVSPFSNRGLNPNGGEVDLVGPGVEVYSSWSHSSLTLPQNYNTIDGTSMATPHVAGIAALLAQANPGVRGKALWNLLLQTARPLASLNVSDVGSGLVQAPLVISSNGT